MFTEVIKLVKEEKKTNEYGDSEVIQSERAVFAELQSVKQSEFYQAQAVGLKPEIVFVLADYLDYDDEKILKYAEKNEEKTYSIIRTYRKTTNELELICKRGID